MVAAVPRKRSGNRRCVSWSKGTGCGGAESLSFGERTGSNGCSAGRWLLPFPGNGPGIGGVFLGWREQAAAGRRASLSGRSRVRTEALRGGGCCRSPETVREQAVCFLVEGDGLRRGGEPLFRGENGFERMLCGAVVAAAPRKRPGCRRRASLSEGTGCGGAASFSFGEGPDSDASPIASAIRLRCSLLSPAACHHPPPATTRRLPPLAACHYPPPATSATVACHPCRCLPSRCCRLPPACHYPPPATSAADCVLTACVSTVCRFFPACHYYLPPAATARRLPPSSFPCLSSSAVACTPAASHPPLPPAATVACHPRYSPQSATTRCLPFPPPCAGRADRWAAAAPRVVGRGAMRRRREVLRNNLENRKILPIFVSVKYRGSGLSRPGFLFFIGLSFLWQKRLSI